MEITTLDPFTHFSLTEGQFLKAHGTKPVQGLWFRVEGLVTIKRG